MFVTSVTRIDSRRQKVTLDNEYVFSLYNSEIRKYNIEVDASIDEAFINMLENEILYPRAKDRALYILERSDKTKKQIVDKLKESYYPECIINKVTNFLMNYGYIDDVRFAENYVKMKRTSKSRRKIEGELIQKGISIEIIKNSFDDSMDDYEFDVLMKLLNKSKYKMMIYDKNNRQKVFASMLRRGFSYEQITRCIEKIQINT